MEKSPRRPLHRFFHGGKVYETLEGSGEPISNALHTQALRSKPRRQPLHSNGNVRTYQGGWFERTAQIPERFFSGQDRRQKFDGGSEATAADARYGGRSRRNVSFKRQHRCQR